MRVEKLSIQNFRGFRDFVFEFPENNVVVFIGENGAGKSTVLDVLDYLFTEITYYLSRQIRHIIGDKNVHIEANKAKLETSLSIQDKLSCWIVEYDKGTNTEQKLIPNNQFAKALKPVYPLGNKSGKDYLPYYYSFYFSSHHKPVINDVLGWLRERVSIENAIKINEDLNHQDALLTSLREAIHIAVGYSIKTGMGGDKSLKVFFEQENKKFEFDQLSAGERKRILFVFEVVHFLHKYSSEDADIFQLPAVVMIDEIELHLHPKWQRSIVADLCKTFPHIQFIITTHSPQVVSGLPRESVFVLDDFRLKKAVHYTEGRDSNSILYDLFGVEKRPAEAEEELNQLYNLMKEENLEEAKKAFENLRAKWGGSDVDITRAEMYLEDLEEELDD